MFRSYSTGLAALAMVGMLLAGGARAASSTAPVLLVVGDSLSAAYKIPIDKGWVHLLQDRLGQKGYTYRVVNASIPGDTTAGGLARLPGDLKRYRPAIVVIALGGNDGLQGLPLDQMRDNLVRMVEQSRASGARVLLVGVRMPPNYGPVYTRRFEAVFKAVAKKTGAALVPEILAGVATHPELMQAGGLHPRAAGEPRVLDNVWKGLEPLLQHRHVPGTGSEGKTPGRRGRALHDAWQGRPARALRQ